MVLDDLLLVTKPVRRSHHEGGSSITRVVEKILLLDARDASRSHGPSARSAVCIVTLSSVPLTRFEPLACPQIKGRR